MKNNNNIEISALRVFSAVSDAESLTQAAERLGITQSAVSQTIKQLELQRWALQLELSRGLIGHSRRGNLKGFPEGNNKEIVGKHKTKLQNKLISCCTH